MVTVSVIKKTLLFLVAVCALLFTLTIVVNNVKLPVWRQLANLTYARQWSVNTKNTLSDTSNSGKVPAQKPGNIDKLNDKQLSTSQQGRQPERSTVLNGSHLLHNVSDKGTSPPLTKTSHLIPAQNISPTSQQAGNEMKDNKGSRPETDVLLLADILNKKLSNVSISVQNFRPTCENDFKLANSCDNNKCLQTDLPKNVTARVEQLVTPRKLQMSSEEHEILLQMANNMTGNYEITLLTAASSNHFLEAQAMLKNLHDNVFPHLKNFTLVFYNLGLTEQERTLLVKYCRCQVIDFPFHKFPPFMKILNCYAWKPIVIKAHLQKTDLVFWMDVSIRFHNASTHLHHRFQIARERGFHVGGPNGPSVFRNHRGMHHFFGDEPCAYLNLQQAAATFGIYHREYFVDRVVLEPWVACALNENCMCLEPKTSINCAESFKMHAKYSQGGPIVYGLCHRFDQSGISIILHKLYQELYLWVMVADGPVLSINRDHVYAYFESLMKSETTVKP